MKDNTKEKLNKILDALSNMIVDAYGCGLPIDAICNHKMVNDDKPKVLVKK